MIIEKLNIDDIPNLLKLYDELISFESSLDKSIETYKEMLMDENYFLIVAKEDTKIVGSVLGIYCKCLVMPFLVIEDVIVKDGLRGKGIGRELMETMDEFAKTKDCSYAILVSSDYRKKAHKFYENIGFIDGVRGFRKMYK
jgi:predicted N-acetyltransferase YhbS